jgi:peptidoglycan-N-acetylglucosamine deacetylase
MLKQLRQSHPAGYHGDYMTSNLKEALKHRFAVYGLPKVERKRFLLTFDDGPHPTFTPAILDILNSAHARAIFFMIGSLVLRYPEIVRQVVERGHCVGNHSHTHTKVISPWKAYREIEYCQRALKLVVNQNPASFRPPWGRLLSPSVVYARLRGLRTVLWSEDPKDFRIRTTAGAFEAGIQLADRLNNPERDSDIILLHDDSPFTKVLLEQFLTHLPACDLESGVESF